VTTLPFDLTTQDRFDQFDFENPRVYLALLGFALQAKRNGAQRIGISLLYERLRWYSSFETTDPAFKLRNDFRAFYARKLMQDEPELRGFFITRRSMADRATAD